MDTQHLIAALEEALATVEEVRAEDSDRTLDGTERARLMAPALLSSLHFRAWLAERLEATWQLAEIHGFSEQSDDLCGGPLSVTIGRNGARIS